VRDRGIVAQARRAVSCGRAQDPVCADAAKIAWGPPPAFNDRTRRRLAFSEARRGQVVKVDSRGRLADGANRL
jgi:hypothetical protein